MLSGAIGQGKNSFNNHQCWEVLKNCSRFKIIPTGPTVVLNEMPLHYSQASDSLVESLMNQDSPIQREPRLIGRKAAKTKRGSNSTNDCAKPLAQAKEPRSHQRSKHIQKRYHLIREYVADGDISVLKVASADNIVDPLTKPMSQLQLDRHIEKMGVRYMSDWL
ncbi:hypothetical protein L3X38_017672 [Prunus dulcis]|uniref:Uncharacterized protein n=1 Tax=Prunus dulcis TaxID=3755 RepID=A0AAD4WA61_PRUDU|nr:hypothetical protein L3X38_017672 [Prunus dulcis]